MKLIVAITGASGALYAQRLLSVVADHRSVDHVALIISEQGRMLLKQELDVNLSLKKPDLTLLGIRSEKIVPYHPADMAAPPASGSARYDAMVIVPCSANTLAKVASGIADDLISRAAHVALKERRILVLVTRETPLSLITLRNMVTVTEAGGLIVDASPGFYHRPRTIQDLIDFIVQRVCDHLTIPVDLIPRWHGV